MTTPCTAAAEGFKNASEGITIQIEKEQEADESLNIYLLIIQDAQINFEDGRFSEIKY